LAGGVERWVAASRLGGKVGIHRLFFNETETTSYEELQRKSKAVGDAVKNYLAEMNMPGALYDEMMKIPPSRVMILTGEQLDALQLEGIDPVFEELQTNEYARTYGMSKTEYLQKSKQEDDCREHVNTLKGLSAEEQWTLTESCHTKYFPEYDSSH